MVAYLLETCFVSFVVGTKIFTMKVASCSPFSICFFFTIFLPHFCCEYLFSAFHRFLLFGSCVAFSCSANPTFCRFDILFMFLDFVLFVITFRFPVVLFRQLRPLPLLLPLLRFLQTVKQLFKVLLPCLSTFLFVVGYALP